MGRRVSSLALAPEQSAHSATTAPAAMAAVDGDNANVLQVDRRDFCRLAAACAAGLAITACGGNKSTIDGNGADATTGTADAPQGSGADARAIDAHGDPDASDSIDAAQTSSPDASAIDAQVATPDAQVNPGDPDARPAPDARPVDARPPDARPVDARPPDARPPDARPPDARPPDAHVPPDAAVSTCAPSPQDCGLPTAITVAAPKFFSSGNFFICRDAGGVFAVSAVCTHVGGIVAVNSGEFLCPLHLSEFTFNGAVVRGPASRPLPHFAVCLLPNGHLGVSTGTTVTATIRLDA